MSTIMWAVEKSNPAVEGDFDSIGISMWWTVVNLAGEFPLNGDLSPWGKFVSSISMILSIGGVFGVAASILGDGFQDIISERREEKQQKEMEEELEADNDSSPQVCLLSRFLDISTVNCHYLSWRFKK